MTDLPAGFSIVTIVPDDIHASIYGVILISVSVICYMKILGDKLKKKNTKHILLEDGYFFLLKKKINQL